MKKYGADQGKGHIRALCILSALLFLCMWTGMAAAEESPKAMDPPEVILAKDAASKMDLRSPDGGKLQVRSNPEIAGRGQADPEGNEPDYIGMIGFAALSNDPEISHFSAFDKAYWMIPEFIIKDGKAVQTGNIPHKTPLVVTGQRLKADENDGFNGLLQVVRLDISKECVIDVSCFVTLPYWTLPISKIPAYGWCIAVYRETPGEGPRDEDGNACTIRDGTRVLIPYEAGYSPDQPVNPNLPVCGIVFRENGEGSIHPQTICFREADLVLNY